MMVGWLEQANTLAEPEDWNCFRTIGLVPSTTRLLAPILSVPLEEVNLGRGCGVYNMWSGCGVGGAYDSV